VAYAFDSAQHGADLFDLKVPGNIYTRIMNPTQAVLEERLAALEGGIGALALASGQAAITYAIQTITEAGDNIVSASALYGGTYNLFAHTPAAGRHRGAVCRQRPARDVRALDRRAHQGHLLRIEWATRAGNGHRHRGAGGRSRTATGCPSSSTTTVPSPYLWRPFEHGADIVVPLRLTKYLARHGNSVAAPSVDSGKFPWGRAPGALSAP
jgi:O-acetylhomoserine (thiol)-lyase